jgi:hypothetical protein
MEALIKRKYRKEFGLTTEQFEQEPIDEIYTIMEIWQAEADKEKLEGKRSQQSGRSQKT